VNVGPKSPFNSSELMELLRGLERRDIRYEIKHRRVTADCDGINVRIITMSYIWDVGFYDNDHIEILKYVLSGDVQTGVTAASVLSGLDQLQKSH
jgi:hypothetical protein